MELVDIGVNLAHQRFADDRDAVVARARAAGVTAMVVTGVNLPTSAAAVAIAARHAGLVTTAGVHPHYAADFDDAAAEALATLVARPTVAALGECGLDFHRNFSTPAQQVRCFAAQLDLAVRLGKPLFLHQRDACDRLLGMLADHGDRLPRAVVHCFTGNETELRACLDRGLYIGITGWICDERRGTHLRDLLHLIPEDRLMLETDAPFLLPRTIRPKPRSSRCEPAMLPYVCAAVAEALGQSPETVAARTTAVARAFFNLALEG